MVFEEARLILENSDQAGDALFKRQFLKCQNDNTGMRLLLRDRPSREVSIFSHRYPTQGGRVLYDRFIWRSREADPHSELYVVRSHQCAAYEPVDRLID